MNATFSRTRVVGLVAGFAVAVVLAVGVEPAGAARSCPRTDPHVELACGQAVLRKSEQVVRWILHRRARTIDSQAPVSARRFQRLLRYRERLVRMAHGWIRDAERRLQPATAAVAHLAFWECVHSGEGNGSPSLAHPYSGPLQMTSGWAGYPVYDWSTVPVMEVYADAEAQFQKHERAGDLYAWLAQQWPNTSGRCLVYAG